MLPFFFEELDYTVDVKNVFLSFLALLMFMPSLACAMPVCLQPMPKSPVSLASSAQKPCHGHEKNEEKPDHIRFVIDCMGVDLQKAESSHFEKYDTRTVLIDLPFLDNAVTSQNTDYSPQIIRGPPPNWAVAYQSQASIILTTQRLRI